MGGTVVLREKWPVIGRHEQATTWLQIWADLGRAPRTIDAYARGLAEYLLMCEREGVDPVTANRAHVAVFVRELTSRPSLRGANVVAIDSGSGLANATIQQRLVPVRLFYDFLMEEGLRESNPVGRGRYTPGGRAGGQQRGLVPRLTRLPWIPSEQEWLRLLEEARREPARNRLMLALAYDAALRREELCSLRTERCRPGAPHAAGPGGDDEEPAGARRAVLGLNRGAAVAVPRAPGLGQPGRRDTLPVGVASQLCPAAQPVDLVEGDPPDRAGLGCRAVLHAYDPAPLPDGPGEDGLGGPRDRHVRRAPSH